MENETYSATLVSIVGQSHKQAYVLGNLYEEPFDPEYVTSVVLELEHKPNVKWKKLYSTPSWCTSMDRSFNGVLYVVSMEGEVHIFEAQSWQTVDLQCPDGLNSVYAANEDEAFMVGLSGQCVHWKSNNFTKIQEPGKRRLNAVHGCDADHVIAVGDEGLVYYFDGNTWDDLQCPTNLNILAVVCCSPDLAYLAGTDGLLFKWDGVGFHALEAPDCNITDLAIFNSELYAAAGLKGIFKLDGDTLELFKELPFPIYRINSLGDRLFGIGSNVVVQYDGKEWWGGALDL